LPRVFGSETRRDTSPSLFSAGRNWGVVEILWEQFAKVCSLKKWERISSFLQKWENWEFLEMEHEKIHRFTRERCSSSFPLISEKCGKSGFFLP
jgi:hypothetical protein